MQVLKLDHFSGRLNETFHAEIGDGRIAFVLVEAQPLPQQHATGLDREPFSLLFRSESETPLPQGIYNMQDASMGEFGIFLVPIARDHGGFLYHAVFN